MGFMTESGHFCVSEVCWDNLTAWCLTLAAAVLDLGNLKIGLQQYTVKLYTMV